MDLKNFPINLILRIVGMILPLITPQIKEFLEEFLDNLEEKAKATPNPWDDIFVGLLRTVTSLDDD